MHMPQDIANWLAESLRFTLFSNSTLPLTSAEEWWLQFDENAQLEDISKKPHSTELVLTGKYDELNLQLRIIGNRLDWILTPSTELVIQLVESNQAQIPTLGKFVDIKDRFEQSFLNWLRKSSNEDISFVRFAFGCIFLKETESHESGYNQISSILPFIQVNEKWRDFNIQFNETSQIEIGVGEKLEINNIKRYSLLRVSTQDRLNEHTTKLGYFLRVELDANTSAASKIDLKNSADTITKHLILGY